MPYENAAGNVLDNCRMKNRVTLIENEYAYLWYYPDASIVYHKFLQPVSDESFRNVLLTGLNLLREDGAKKWLSDDRNNSILSAEDSGWSQDFWLPRALKTDWEYWAVLPPSKARGQVNMKRLVGYVSELRRISIEVFTDPDEAWQWLYQQGVADCG
jgi:hypothetical protein